MADHLRGARVGTVILHPIANVAIRVTNKQWEVKGTSTCASRHEHGSSRWEDVFWWPQAQHS